MAQKGSIKTKNPIYHINTFILFIAVIFVSTLVIGSFFTVQSEDGGDDDATDSIDEEVLGPNALVILKKVNVKFDPEEYEVQFQSDGINGTSVNAERRAQFALSRDSTPVNPNDVSPDDGSEEGGSEPREPLVPIDIPIKYSMTDSYVDLPGEIVYKAVRKANAPTSVECTAEDTEEGGVRDDENCLYGVMYFSAFAEVTKSQVIQRETDNPERSDEIETQQDSAFNNVFNNFIRYLGDVFSVDKGVGDKGKSAVGSVTFGASDELNSAVRINGDLEAQAKVTIDSTANTINEDYYVPERSPDLRYNGNGIEVNAFETTLKSSDVGPIFNLKDPYTKRGELTQGSENSGEEADEEGGAVEFFKDLFDVSFLFPAPEESFEQTEQNLAGHVALRPISKTDEFNTAYNFCDALEEQGVDYGEYSLTSDQAANANINSGYRSVNSSDKRCLHAVYKYQGQIAGDACLERLVDGNDGCSEFTIEEEELKFSMDDSTLPIGLQSTFQNPTLSHYDPKSAIGPYINYLSPYFCSKLTIKYDIQTGKNYMYRIGAGQGDYADPDNASFASAGDEAAAIGEYCVVGTLLSNFSWVFFQAANNQFNTQRTTGTVNMPEEALTCDKKEMAIFGANEVWADVQEHDDQLVHMLRDNGDGRVTNSDRTINMGYNPYPLHKVIKEVGSPIFRDNIRVLSGNSNEPEFVYFSTAKDNEAKGSFICSLDDYMPLRAEKIPGEDDFYRRRCVKISDDQKHIGYGSVFQPSNEEGAENIYYFAFIEHNPEQDDAPDVIARFVKLDLNNLEDPIQINETKRIDGFNKNLDSTIRIDTSNFRGIGVSLQSDHGGPDTRVTVVLVNPFTHEIIKSMNLCSGANTPYCQEIGETIISSKITQNGNIISFAMTGAGFGMVYTDVSPFIGASGEVPEEGVGNIFAFKKHSNIYKDEGQNWFDQISEYQALNGVHHIFMRKSGYYLRVMPQPGYFEGRSPCKGNNCYAAYQYKFDPDVFDTDCSDYFGRGVCGYPKLNEIGTPEIVHSRIDRNGHIKAWYKYKNLAHTIMYSPDLLYSYTGEYTAVATSDSGAGPASPKEYSNVYVPVRTEREGGDDTDGNGIYMKPTPIPHFSFIDYTLAPLRDGLELKVSGQGAGAKIVEVESVMKPLKHRCKQFLRDRVISVDEFFDNTGLKKPGLEKADVTLQVTDNPLSNTSGEYSSFNPDGKYCEETWCITDKVQFLGNPGAFGEDGNNDTVKNAILQYIGEVTGNRGAYTRYVDYMCAEAAKKGVACEILAAIWRQESGFARSGTVMGCFGSAATRNGVEAQMQCVLNESLAPNVGVRYQEFLDDPNSVQFSGPGSEFTHPSGNIGKADFTGTCQPATLFSHVFQRYTPSDTRINYNNQCNRGLVVREDHGSYCSGDWHKNMIASDYRWDASQTPNPWPVGKMLDMRPNMHKALVRINEILGSNARLEISNQCYPSSGPGGTQTVADIGGVEDLRNQVEQIIDIEEEGVHAMNLANWGKGKGAGNIRIALDKFNLEGIHTFGPGGTYSANDIMTNPTASEVIAHYNEYEQQGYSFNGPGVVGGGWCELTSSIAKAAKNNPQMSDQRPVGGMSSPAVNTTGRGYNGDPQGTKPFVRHFQHTNVTVNSFNRSLALDMNNDGVLGNDEKLPYEEDFVVIWSLGAKKAFPNDGDMEIVNKTNKTMVVATATDQNQVVWTMVAFGTPKNGGDQNENDQQEDNNDSDEQSNISPSNQSLIKSTLSSPHTNLNSLSTTTPLFAAGLVIDKRRRDQLI